MSAIVSFYAGELTDDRGRRLADIQQWSDERLESVHDFIQWMFPLREPSGVNPDAPILDEKTIQTFRSRPDLQQNLRTSLVRMLRFYGLELVPAPDLEIVRAANFAQRSGNWLILHNHNHLRITRILKSLRALGLEDEAAAFFERLAEIYQSCPGTVSAETFRFWRSAAGR